MTPVLAFHLLVLFRQAKTYLSQSARLPPCRRVSQRTEPSTQWLVSQHTVLSFLLSSTHLPTDHWKKKKRRKKSADLSFSRLLKIIVATTSSVSVSLRKPVALFTAQLWPTEVFLDQRAKRCASWSATFNAVRAEQLNTVLKNTGSVSSKALINKTKTKKNLAEWRVGTVKVYKRILLAVCRQRPYHVESTGSRPITEVKQRRARLVLGWVTAWEHRVLLTTFFFVFLSSFQFFLQTPSVASVIFFCTFRLFFFLMLVTFCRRSRFLFLALASASIFCLFLSFLFFDFSIFFIQFQFNLRTG